jgi:ElaA protein
MKSDVMLNYECLPFNKLSNIQLYKILRLRQEVFVVEQNCPYLDADDKDQESYHVLGIDADGTIQSYARLLPPGISYSDYSAVGRVTTSARIRGKNQGKPLMQYAIDQCFKIWPQKPIKISAQTYIVKFYHSLGFVEIGNEYLEDDIPHIAMIRQTN